MRHADQADGFEEQHRLTVAALRSQLADYPQDWTVSFGTTDRGEPIVFSGYYPHHTDNTLEIRLFVADDAYFDRQQNP